MQAQQSTHAAGRCSSRARRALEGQAREPWQARHWQQKQLDSTQLTAAAVSSYERLRIAEGALRGWPPAPSSSGCPFFDTRAPLAAFPASAGTGLCEVRHASVIGGASSLTYVRHPVPDQPYTPSDTATERSLTQANSHPTHCNALLGSSEKRRKRCDSPACVICSKSSEGSAAGAGGLLAGPAAGSTSPCCAAGRQAPQCDNPDVGCFHSSKHRNARPQQQWSRWWPQRRTGRMECYRQAQPREEQQTIHSNNKETIERKQGAQGRPHLLRGVPGVELPPPLLHLPLKGSLAAHLQEQRETNSRPA